MSFWNHFIQIWTPQLAFLNFRDLAMVTPSVAFKLILTEINLKENTMNLNWAGEMVEEILKFINFFI